MRAAVIVALVALLLAGIVTATQLTFVAIQPIGAVPDGAVLVIWRRGTMQMFDGPDAFCQRSGGVSLLCRGAALAAFTRDPPLARLPFAWWVYDLSTDGKRYER